MDNGLVAIAAGIGAALLFKTGAAPAATQVTLPNGNRVLPNGQVVNGAGQVVGQVTQPATTRLYAAQAARGGSDALEVIQFAAGTLKQLPTVYNLVQKILATRDAPAAAGVAQQLLRDPQGLTTAVDLAGANMSVDEALRLGDSFLDGGEQFNLAEMLSSDPELFDLLDTNLADYDAIVNLDTLIPDDFVGDLPIDVDVGDLPDWNVDIDVPGGDVLDELPFGGSTSGGGFNGLPSGGELALDGIGDAGEAVTAGIDAAGVGGGGLQLPSLPNIPIGAVITAVVSIAMTAASNMPNDQKALAAALDVANLALAFIPIVGWLLAIIGALVKPMIMGLFGTNLSHEQREQLETARALQNTKSLWTYHVRRACTPTQLWEGLRTYASPAMGGLANVAQDGTAVGVHYIRPDGVRCLVGSPQNATSPYRIGNAQELVDVVSANPSALSVAIQAGVAPDRLAAANDFFRQAIAKRAKLIAGAQRAEQDSLRTLFHVWHITRDPALNVRTYLDGTNLPEPYRSVPFYRGQELTTEEVPPLAETLLSVYYNDLAAVLGVTSPTSSGKITGDWRKLVGLVLQPQWDAYRAAAARAGQSVTLSGFVAALGYRDLRDLRADVFAGKFPMPSLEGTEMLEEIANAQRQLQHNVDALNRVLSITGVWSRRASELTDYNGLIHRYTDVQVDAAYAAKQEAEARAIAMIGAASL